MDAAKPDWAEKPIPFRGEVIDDLSFMQFSNTWHHVVHRLFVKLAMLCGKTKMLLVRSRFAKPKALTIVF